MVHLIPNDRFNTEFNQSRGEKILYEKFKSLSDDFYIFHSMHIPVKTDGYLLDKEFDYIVFNPHYGILCIEVKSGNIICENGRIKQQKSMNIGTKENDGYKYIDPLAQIRNAKYQLIAELKRNYPKGFTSYAINSCVWFTDINKKNTSGELPINYRLYKRTLWKDDIDNIEETLISIFKNQQVKKKYKEKNESAINTVLNTIAPHFSAIVPMNELFQLHKEVFKAMTLNQMEAMKMFEENKVVLVEGMAGTGKSILALERAKNLSKRNEDTLIICFNRFLKEYFVNYIDKYASGIKVMNLHNLYYYHNKSYCKKLTKEVQIDLLKTILSNIDDFPFSNIIIDEAQDFSYEILDLFYNIVKEKSGNFYAFYDINQKHNDNNSDKWLLEFEAPRCKLFNNCRNTVEITETISKLNLIEKTTSKYEVRGMYPQLYIQDNPVVLIDKLKEKISYYKSEGIDYKDMVILSLNSSLELDEKRFEGLNVSIKEKDNHILLTTVRKFKGLEAEVVFIIDIPDSIFDNEKEKNLFYIALSRARHITEGFLVFNEKEKNKFKQSLGASDELMKNKLFEKFSIKLIE
ncbi:NERD domain-containing protein [Staphylococcus equorum]